MYDADRSTFPAPEGVPIAEGSAAIENLYESYYTEIGEPYDDTQFPGRSDDQAFILAGIPSGGLFTGAEVIKTEEQAAIRGGTGGAGRPVRRSRASPSPSPRDPRAPSRRDETAP